MKFAERLKQERTLLGLSQEALAKQLNVSRQAVSKWETGQGYPDLETLIHLSDLFHITLDELVRGDQSLESKLIRDSRNSASVWGYVLVALGIMVAFWGGSKFPVDLMNKGFIAYLTGALVLVTLGIWISIKLPRWVLIASLYLTLIASIVYMADVVTGIWVILMGIVVVIGLGWWLTIRIMGKKE